MRFSLSALLLGLALPFVAQAQGACTPSALSDAAQRVATVRHALRGVAVGELDPVVPPAVSAQITQLKDALAAVAEAAMACAPPTVTPEALQMTLTTALRANISKNSESVLITRGGKDLGAYGSDLDVQVLPLTSNPRYLEVSFRFGIECGDDNLLLVFHETQTTGDNRWNEILRYTTPPYSNISGALGDFVLMTPLTGLPPKTNWRVVVAYGQPSCSTAGSRGQFRLQLLEPTADPAHPTVAWHLERPYRRGDTPRLATTEETLTFEMVSPQTEKSTGKKSAPARPATEAYQYHVSSDNVVQAVDTVPEGLAHPATAPASQP